MDRHISAESDDDAAKQSEMTLEHVMAKMKAAAAAGCFHGRSTAATNAVSFLAALVVDSFAVEVAKKALEDAMVENGGEVVGIHFS